MNILAVFRAQIFVGPLQMVERDPGVHVVRRVEQNIVDQVLADL